MCPREEWGQKLLLLFSGQEELRKHLDRVVFYDLKKWAQCSHPTFLDVFQVRTCLPPPSLPHGVLGPFPSTWPGEGDDGQVAGHSCSQDGRLGGGRAPGIEASESEGPGAGLLGISSGEGSLPGMSQPTVLLGPQVGRALGSLSGDALGRERSPIGVKDVQPRRRRGHQRVWWW